MNIKISVITVCFNSEKTIKDTVNSVLTQNYDNIEYIVIDGCSSDKTLDILNSFKKSFKDRNLEYKIVSEKDDGLYDAMNKGLKLATGDLIGIINSDDWYEADAFSHVSNIYNNFENKSLVIHGCSHIIGSNDEYLFTVKKGVNKSLSKIINDGLPLSHPATFVSSKSYGIIGFFSLNYKICADYDLIYRFYSNDIQFVSTTYVLSSMRQGGLSESYKSYYIRLFEHFNIRKNYINIFLNIFIFIKTFISFSIKANLKYIIKVLNFDFILNNYYRKK